MATSALRGPAISSARSLFNWPDHGTRVLSGLLILSVLASLCSAGGLTAVDGKWKYFTSPHFELYSRNGDEESRELLHNLETLRAVFFERLNLKERVHVDVTVFYFRKREEFQAYAPALFQNQDALAGFHFFQSDRATISMAPAEDSEAAQQTIFHEYVHHLFRVAEVNPPLWFNEGTAEVLSGMRVTRDKVYIGTPLENQAVYLARQPLIPLEALFAANQNSSVFSAADHTGIFYAESWALIHFLEFGKSGFSKEAVANFMRVAGDRDASEKTDMRKLFQSSFGCDYAVMGRKLQDYVRSGSYRAYGYAAPMIDPASTYAVRPVPVEEITLRLAELSVRVLNSGVGQLVLLNAISAKTTDPRVYEAIGAEALARGEDRTTTERWEQAVAVGSKNPAIVRELALIEGRRWFGHYYDEFELPEEPGARLRERLLHSLEIEPSQSACYEMLAWVEAFSKKPNPKNINAVIAHLPGMSDKRKTLIALARIMIRIANYDAAAMMLNHLDRLTLDPFDTYALSELRKRLQNEQRQGRDPTPAPKAEAPASP